MPFFCRVTILVWNHLVVVVGGGFKIPQTSEMLGTWIASFDGLLKFLPWENNSSSLSRKSCACLQPPVGLSMYISRGRRRWKAQRTLVETPLIHLGGCAIVHRLQSTESSCLAYGHSSIPLLACNTSFEFALVHSS